MDTNVSIILASIQNNVYFRFQEEIKPRADEAETQKQPGNDFELSALPLSAVTGKRIGNHGRNAKS